MKVKLYAVADETGKLLKGWTRAVPYYSSRLGANKAIGQLKNTYYARNHTLRVIEGEIEFK